MDHILKIDSPNPDSGSIVNKEQIDISISLFDITTGSLSGSIITNYTATSQIISLPLGEEVPSNMYYTPIYEEKLSYSEWLVRINKNFEELT
jgi:hypothetical protein